MEHFTEKSAATSTVFLLFCRSFSTHKAQAICQEESGRAEEVSPSPIPAGEAVCILPTAGGNPSRWAGSGQAGSCGYLRGAAQLPACQAARYAPAGHVPQRQPLRWPAGNSWGCIMTPYSGGWPCRGVSGFTVGTAGSAQHFSGPWCCLSHCGPRHWFPQCCLNRHDRAALSLSTEPLLFAGLFLQNISVLLCFLSVSPFSCVFLSVSLVDICFLYILL